MSDNIDAELDEFLAGLDKEISGQGSQQDKTPAPTAAPAPTQAPTASPEPPTEAPDQGEPRVGIEVSPAIGGGVAQGGLSEGGSMPPPATPYPSNPSSPEPGVAKQADGSALKTYIDAEQLKKDVQVSITDLDNVMIQHAALYAHYAMQTVNARRQYDRVKSAVDILEAQLDSFYRNRAADEGKKTTEAQLRNQVVGDPRYADAQKKLIDAHSIWKLADIAERAMGDQRKDLILELARDRRKEREGQMRVMESNMMKDEIRKQLAERAAA